MILTDIDLLEGVGTASEIVVDGPEFLNLSSGEHPPGELLDGPDEDLSVDEGVDPEEVADLIGDAQRDKELQCPEEEGGDNIGPGYDPVEEVDHEESENYDDVMKKEMENDKPDLIAKSNEDMEQQEGPPLRDIRPARSIRPPERYSPETGHSYAQIDACHNIRMQCINSKDRNKI